MKNIAIIHFGKIGDTINVSPVCSTLKKVYPDSKLIFITIPEGKETVKCLPGVDKIVVFEKDGKHRSAFELLKFITVFRLKNKIDMAIILTNTFRAAMLAFLLGAKKRVGIVSDGRSFLLTHKKYLTPEEHNASYSDALMNILKAIDIYSPKYDILLNYSEEDKKYIEKLLLESEHNSEQLIGICPCASTCSNWSPEEAAKLIKSINNQGHYKVVVVGDNSGQEFVDKIKQCGETNFIDLTGQTSISQLVALVSKFKRFISVDTGPAHIAYATKVPTVILFLREYSKCWQPKNMDINTIVHNDTLFISAEEIITELNNLDNKLTSSVGYS